MEVIDKEICLALVSSDDCSLGFTNRQAYLDFLKQNPDKLTPQTGILVIVMGGDSVLVSPKLAARMYWARPD